MYWDESSIWISNAKSFDEVSKLQEVEWRPGGKGAWGRHCLAGDHVHVGVVAVQDLDEFGAVGIVGQFEGTVDTGFVGGVPAVFVAAVAVVAIDDLGAGGVGRAGAVAYEDDVTLDSEADADVVGGAPDVFLGIGAPGSLVGFGSIVDRLGLCRKREGEEEGDDGDELFHGFVFLALIDDTK